MKTNTVIQARVSRRADANSALELATQRRREADIERQRAAHDAALHVMDVIDAISGPIPRSGPRTGAHPLAVSTPLVSTPLNQRTDTERSRSMATPIDKPIPEPRPVSERSRSMATRIPAHFVDPATIRLAQRLPLLLGWLMAFVGGIVLGKAL